VDHVDVIAAGFCWLLAGVIWWVLLTDTPETREGGGEGER
jgi:hypothetical protein